MKTYTIEQLKEFELKVIKFYEDGKIKGPIHLSHGNEEPLIEIFKEVNEDDWVFSTWRNHYHALLKGIPEDWLLKEILECRSINISNGDYKFHTSAIVGGTLPIAVGLASAIKLQNKKEKVWCFIGDMSAESGMYKDCKNYAKINELPIIFVIEDNGLSTNTPTKSSFYLDNREILEDNNYNKVYTFDKYTRYYQYQRKFPHVGIGKFIYF
jgi:TPP-dependent pyruvate/acetoin dehydrogenase alpha subunit